MEEAKTSSIQYRNRRTQECPVCHKKIKQQNHNITVRYYKTTYCSNECFNHI